MSNQKRSPKKKSKETNVRESKTNLKKKSRKVQELGERLLTLSNKQLSAIPLEDERLREAIKIARQIKTRSAKRRQLQYIGKLMRDLDSESIAIAIANLDN